jgi:TolA-binding protein
MMIRRNSKMLRRLLALALFACPTLYCADKTTDAVLEVLRDLDGMQQQMKAMQASLEAKLAGLTQAGADQARAAAEQASKTMADLTSNVQKSLQGQQDEQTKTLDTMAALGSQIQAVADQLSTTRQAVSDLTAAVNRISTQLTDLTNIVKSTQAAASATGGTPQPTISATDLIASAEGDRLGGNLQLSLQEYTDYVSKFPNSPQASDAQYYIGSIHYSNQEWDDAVQAFDTLIKNYPDSKRMPETLFYKADSLANLGRWPEANETLKDLRKRFPDNALAQQKLTVQPPK